MKRVLEVVGRMDRAGQETFLMNLLRSHDPNRYEITFSVNTNHVGDYESEILEVGGKIWHNPYPISPKTIIPYLREFRKFLYNQGPFDVIHCHVYFFGGFILKEARKAGIPVRIMHSHSTNDGRKDSFLRSLYRKYSYNLIKKNSTHYVGCGIEAYEALFKEKCPVSKNILNNGIIMDLFNISRDLALQKKEELGISGYASVVINIARFCEVKNHEKTVSVFNAFLKYNPNSVLLLVGEGERMAMIKQVVNELGIAKNVKFLGMRSDIPELLGLSNVLLMPSLFEGLPVSLIEAQAAGLPCVISDTITREVDMNIGIVEFLPLDSSDDSWAVALSRLSKIEKPSFEIRKEYLTTRGYTIDSTWEKLSKLYG